jgi:hypothetical protein
MADIKTVENDGEIEAFLASVANETRRKDARTLIDLMQRVTGQPPRMWGPSIIGFGRYHYTYASGREGDMCAAGFSPRKAATTVYFEGFDDYADDLARLGPHTTSVSCLYIKRLDDIDLGVLEDMLRRSYATVTAETFGLRLP